MENNRYRLCDVEEAVGKMDLMDIPDDLVEIEGVQLVASGWHVEVESLGLNLQRGIVCIWDPEAGMFLPDADVTVISEGEPQIQGWIWYAQAGFAASVALWLEGRMAEDQAEQLWCRLILPDSDKVDGIIIGKRGTVYDV